MTLVTMLARAHGEGRLEDKLMQFAKPRPTKALLAVFGGIVNELGYLPLEPTPRTGSSSCSRAATSAATC